MTTPCPPFSIFCLGEESPNIQDYPTMDGSIPSRNRHGDDWIYLGVETPLNKWRCRVKREHLSMLFDEINVSLPTPIEFSND